MTLKRPWTIGLLPTPSIWRPPGWTSKPAPLINQQLFSGMRPQNCFQAGDPTFIKANNLKQTIKPFVSSLVRGLITPIGFGGHSAITFVSF